MSSLEDRCSTSPGIPSLVFFRSGYGISMQEGYQDAVSIEQWVNGVGGPDVEEFATCLLKWARMGPDLDGMYVCM